MFATIPETENQNKIPNVDQGADVGARVDGDPTTRVDRFARALPAFLLILESEWRRSLEKMSGEERELFRQAHASLGRLNELLEERAMGAER